MGNNISSTPLARNEKTFEVSWHSTLILPYEGLKSIDQYRNKDGCHYYFIYEQNTPKLACYGGKI